MQCAQLIDFYLREENKAHWEEIQSLSGETTQTNWILTNYVLEGARLSNSLGIFRDVEPVNGECVTIVQNGQTITAKKGDRLFVSFVYHPEPYIYRGRYTDCDPEMNRLLPQETQLCSLTRKFSLDNIRVLEKK